MDLVHDLLDKLVKDRNGREMGRVDGVVMELRSGTSSLRVVAIEIGPVVLGYRLHPFAGRLVAALEHAFGVDAGRPVRIALGDVIDVGTEIKVDRTIGETAAGAIEKRLRACIGKIPGGG